MTQTKDVRDHVEMPVHVCVCGKPVSVSGAHSFSRFPDASDGHVLSHGLYLSDNFEAASPFLAGVAKWLSVSFNV